MSADSAKDVRYPLGEHHRDAIRSATGRPRADLSLEAIRDGSMTAADLTIHRETLELQATIAEEAGFPQVAKGLRRAAGFLQRQLGRELRLRSTPRLTFAYDAGLENLIAVSELLSGLENDQ